MGLKSLQSKVIDFLFIQIPTKCFEKADIAMGKLPVDFFAVSDSHYENDKEVILELAKNAVIAAAVTPDMIQFTFKLFAPLARIVCALDTFVQKCENLPGCLSVKFLELFEGFFGNSIVPVHVWLPLLYRLALGSEAR